MSNSCQRVLCCLLTVSCLGCGAQIHPSAESKIARPEHAIPLAVLEDKIRGGWAGQMIGVSYGFPTEFAYRERVVPQDALPLWKPEMIAEALVQDDLYVDMTFAQVMDSKGIDATTQDYGAQFRTTRYPLWHANLVARRALRRGVPAMLTGTPEINPHYNDIDFQIEADFIGLMSPGMPNSSNRLSLNVGRVTNSGDGIYGGMFVNAMYAAAFFETSPELIVEAGVKALPPDSGYALVIEDVLTWWRADPEDWQATWARVHQKWNTGEMCPEGAMDPFNIDARLNGAYVAMGLLYGSGDFESTMRLATRAGQDSDCNPASALGILGVAYGYGAIPSKFTEGLAAISDRRFSFTEYSYNTIVQSTIDRAVELALSTGGQVEDNQLWIHRQQPEPLDAGQQGPVAEVVEQISYDDSRWQWEGEWQTEQRKIWLYTIPNRISAQAGAQARVKFSGTGVLLTGLYLPTGGLANIYLDDALVATVDVYPDEPDPKFGQALWHAYDLKPGVHELRIVVKGEPYVGPEGLRSEGGEIAITGIKVLR